MSLTDPKHGNITGIYYDSRASLGVTFSGPPSVYPHISRPDPATLGDTKMSCIPSKIQMKDVRRIDVWYTDNRCIGLMITFANYRQDSLGRWDKNSPHFSQQTVFNADCDTITFDSMEISMKHYWYENRDGNGTITLVKSGYYIVNGISVGTIKFGDMTGDKCLIVSKDVRVHVYYSYRFSRLELI